MSKSLYSLILMDDVVREIDRVALRENTNRSNLVNRILAEYASMLTPEKRIGGIYKHIEQLMSQTVELVPAVSTRGGVISVKSCLNYKYRPTIRYEVQLYREPEQYIGELSIIFRTQSEDLLGALTDFFRLWKMLEDRYAAESVGPVRYALYDGRFVRSISVPRDRDYNGDEVGKAITDYVELLDGCMKDYISHGCSVEHLEKRYCASLADGRTMI